MYSFHQIVLDNQLWHSQIIFWRIHDLLKHVKSEKINGGTAVFIPKLKNFHGIPA